MGAGGPGARVGRGQDAAIGQKHCGTDGARPLITELRAVECREALPDVAAHQRRLHRRRHAIEVGGGELFEVPALILLQALQNAQTEQDGGGDHQARHEQRHAQR